MKTILNRAKSLNWQKPATWILLSFFSVTHVTVVWQLPFAVDTYFWLFPLVVAIPGLLSMALIPGAWRRWYRWVAVIGLAMTTYADAFVLVVAVAETWAHHRMWVIERTVPIKRLLTGRRAGTIKPRTA